MCATPNDTGFWSNYAWPQQGDEWSVSWGGTDFLWWGTIFPRIQAFVPTEAILEIAPGFGRWTQFLKDLCQHLTIVDLTERCIQACKRRFATCSHITYHVNDGKSLAIIPDETIDFVFSFDSLVHAESDVIKAYLGHLVRKLKPDGIGFIHHSNIGAYLDPSKGELPFENTHLRAETVTATLFESSCEEVGLQCISQEIINWGEMILNDCFSLFTRKGSRLTRPNKIVENKNFMDEAARLSALSQLYRFDRVGVAGPVGRSRVEAFRLVSRRVLAKLKLT